jgi:hypothetical protein
MKIHERNADGCHPVTIMLESGSEDRHSVSSPEEVEALIKEYRVPEKAIVSHRSAWSLLPNGLFDDQPGDSAHVQRTVIP